MGNFTIIMCMLDTCILLHYLHVAMYVHTYIITIVLLLFTASFTTELELRELMILRNNYSSLCSIIITDANSLLNHFVEKGIITTDDLKEIINAKNTSDKGVILFGNVIHQLKSHNTTTFYDMLNIMRLHGLLATQELESKISEQLAKGRHN